MFVSSKHTNFVSSEQEQEEEEEILTWETMPNPVKQNQEFLVDFTLKTNKEVEIEMIDIAGRMVRKLDSKLYKRGTNSVPIDVKGLGQGVYIIHFKYDHYNLSRRIVIE